MPRHHLRIDDWLRMRGRDRSSPGRAPLRPGDVLAQATSVAGRRASHDGGAWYGESGHHDRHQPLRGAAGREQPRDDRGHDECHFHQHPCVWATRVALQQPSCLRQMAASCRLRASITACRHPRHGPSLRAQHDEAFSASGILLEHLRDPAIDPFLDVVA